jgi:hypothetical protein
MATQISLNDGAIASAGALAIQTNGTTQAVSISTGQVATLAQNPILTSGTANGVPYLNGSKALTTGSALVFDGTNLAVGAASPAAKFEVSTGAGTKMRLTSTADNNADIDFYTNSVYRGIIEFNSVGGLIYTIPSLPLTFGTNNTERARIDSSGNLLVGTTSQVLTSKISTNFTGNNSNGATFNDTGNGNGAGFIIFSESGTAIGSVSRVASTSAVAFNTTSDYRLKTVTGAVTGQGERIDALNPVDYLWKDGGQQARGFLAHEFQTVYPNSVTGDKDAVDADGNPKHQSMQAATSEVIADLVAEIQSLRKRLAAANI